MEKKVVYMVIDKENKTRWATADSFERLVPVCKYLRKNIKGSDAFTVVWSNGTETKEKNFKEFCEVQGIE